MYDKFRNYITDERLKLYLEYSKNDSEKAVKLYELNIDISSAFNYPLEIFEVILRNSVNVLLMKYYGQKWYDGDFLLEKHKQLICEVKNTLQQDKKEINLNNIVSNVSFGFWVDFFHSKYTNILSDKLRQIFNKSKYNPNILYRKISKVKNNLRNRIAHRENIIKYDIMNGYGLILELISYIDSNIAKYVDSHCKFKRLYLKHQKILDEFYKMCILKR